jgi:hypothetical protein
MTEQTPRKDDIGESERDRRVANIFLLVFFVLVVGAGWWLVDALLTQREIDNCIAQGRRNCAPVDKPVAPPR